jgi:hypothetical protein
VPGRLGAFRGGRGARGLFAAVIRFQRVGNASMYFDAVGAGEPAVQRLADEVVREPQRRGRGRILHEDAGRKRLGQVVGHRRPRSRSGGGDECDVEVGAHCGAQAEQVAAAGREAGRATRGQAVQLHRDLGVFPGRARKPTLPVPQPTEFP